MTGRALLLCHCFLDGPSVVSSVEFDHRILAHVFLGMCLRLACFFFLLDRPLGPQKRCVRCLDWGGLWRVL